MKRDFVSRSKVRSPTAPSHLPRRNQVRLPEPVPIQPRPSGVTTTTARENFSGNLSRNVITAEAPATVPTCLGPEPTPRSPCLDKREILGSPHSRPRLPRSPLHSCGSCWLSSTSTDAQPYLVTQLCAGMHAVANGPPWEIEQRLSS